MRLTISLNSKSLTAALKMIQEYKKDFETKLNRFVERLATEAAAMAQDEFGSDVTVTAVQVDGTHWSVVANGEQVCFLEFGTGVYADSSHDFAQRVPFNVYPGSWSEEHENTYQRWLAKGNDPGEYPYNTLPIRGMLRAYTWMKDNAERIAIEEFNK